MYISCDSFTMPILAQLQANLMHFLILGATGRTGNYRLKYALEQGQ